MINYNSESGSVDGLVYLFHERSTPQNLRLIFWIATVVLILFDNRNGVGPGEPSMQIDIGTPF
jgi:hypothetical protein